MDLFGEIRESLTEILDVEAEEITPETYIIRDLDAESIDLLELSVSINSRFKVEVNDNEIYLKNLRGCLNGANGDAVNRIAGQYPFLSSERAREIAADLEGGPVLKVKDLMAYITWRSGQN
ncbi:MAG: phosphopantetheine-binding protein [Syntrophobacteraceae bacterium]